jgi:hypothetical protein
MDDQPRVDWRSIPRRYRAWRALPPWRKGLWIASRVLAIAVLYVIAAAAILWFNEPVVANAVVAGERPPTALLTAVLARPELGLLAVVVLVGVAAAVLLPHKERWQ